MPARIVVYFGIDQADSLFRTRGSLNVSDVRWASIRSRGAHNATCATKVASLRCKSRPGALHSMPLQGLSSAAGAGSCSVCDESFYLHDERVDRSELLRDPARRCVPCPKHATCGWNATLSNIRPEPGHWRLSALSAVVSTCQGGNAAARCRGGSDAGEDGEGYTATTGTPVQSASSVVTRE